MTASSPTKEDWKTRIEPHLATSLRTVSERITQTEAVQNWIRRASMTAAEGLGQTPGLSGEMQGYMQMMSDLEQELPNLAAAVDELTDGYGHLDLNWHPLRPNSSRLYVDFDLDYEVKLFLRLADCTRERTVSAIGAVVDALPQGDPFPNRPNVATGFVVRNDRGLGVRVKSRLQEDRSGTYRRVTLLPPEEAPIENLEMSAAARTLLQRLCSDTAVS